MLYLRFQVNYLPTHRKNNHPEIKPSSALRGGLSMMSKSGGLKPKAVAGKPSVTLGKRIHYNPHKKMLKTRNLPS